ncbi:hypothetical protein DESA109040_12455 [Deinococcus saxicola]
MNRLHTPPVLKVIEDLACVPKPLSYFLPFTLIVRPSLAPDSPLLILRSMGPQPLLAAVHSESLSILLPVASDS